MPRAELRLKSCVAARDSVETRFEMSSPTGEVESLQPPVEVRLQLSTEQTIGPLLAEKPELAANPGQPSQASHFGGDEADR